MSVCIQKTFAVFASDLRDFAKSRILFFDYLDHKLRSFKQSVVGSSPTRLIESPEKSVLSGFFFLLQYW
jgi:hypothetical protein